MRRNYRTLPILLAVLIALTIAATVAAATPPQTGAVSKPDSFVIVPPWEEGIERRIMRAYGCEGETVTDCTHRNTSHSGRANDYHALDFAFTRGEPIFPVADGVVIFAGRASGNWSGYGNIVFIDHENGYQSLYAHLDSIEPDVLKGANDPREVRVTTATRLGGAGNTGTAEVHLHFALYYGALFYTANNRYGPYGGQAVVPEPFASCIKHGDQACTQLLRGDRLRRVAPTGATPTPLRVAIVRPTTDQPAAVGAPSAPQKLVIELDLSLSDVRTDEIKVMVGEHPATVVTAAGRNRVWVEALPPTQAAEGSYDLTVSVRGVTATAPRAIRYATAVNTDVALVIDRSGSMTTAKMQAAREAAKQFVDLLRSGDQITVASFASSSRVDVRLQAVGPPDDAMRTAVRRSIDGLRAGGSTAIGQGLRRGQDEFDARGDADHARAIILMSDGQENVSPRAESLLPRLIAAGTTLHTVGFGSDADEAQLLRLANATGGTYNFAPTPDQLAGVYSTISGAVGNRQTLRAFQGALAAGEARAEMIDVDASVRDATFALSWTSPGNRIEISLETPSGAVITPASTANNPDVTFVSGSTYAYYRVVGATLSAGQWQLRLNHTGATTRSTDQLPLAEADEVVEPDAGLPDIGEWPVPTIVTKPAELLSLPTQTSNEPFSVRILVESEATLRLFLARDNYRVQEPIQLLATFAGRTPITGASVMVTVLNADGRALGEVRLSDGGTDGDGAANDGVYGGRWVSLQQGSFSFVVNAVGTSAAATLTRQAELTTYIDTSPFAAPLQRQFLPLIRR